MNEVLVEYCAKHGLGLTRSRPYLKNDQAWIEQKNGSVVRRMVGYARLEGITAGQALNRLYASSRLFVNFVQPSFKLAEKHRDGSRTVKRYLAPATPAARLMSAEGVAPEIKTCLKALAESLDPWRLLDEIRAMQHHLAALSKGERMLPGALPASFAVGSRTRLTRSLRRVFEWPRGSSHFPSTGGLPSCPERAPSTGLRDRIPTGFVLRHWRGSPD